MTGRWTAGRYVRTVLGVILFTVNLVLVTLEMLVILRAYLACSKIPPATCSLAIPWENFALHAMLLVASWAMIHKESLLDVLKDLPLVGPFVRRPAP